MQSTSQTTIPRFQDYLKANKNFYSEVNIRIFIGDYFKKISKGFADEFFAFTVKRPTHFRVFRPELWATGTYTGPLVISRENLYSVFNDRKIFNDFNLPYLKQYLSQVLKIKPKRTVIESYMTAGFAMEQLGHPESAHLDYIAGRKESRLESGWRTIYLLETDNVIALPLDTTVRILVTSEDVIHSWAVPAFGVKVDAIPGRLNQVFVTPRVQGVFYGQCSEICGVNHAFMPIKVRVMNNSSFYNWLIYHFAEITKK